MELYHSYMEIPGRHRPQSTLRKVFPLSITDIEECVKYPTTTAVLKRLTNRLVLIQSKYHHVSIYFYLMFHSSNTIWSYPKC